MQVKCKIIGPLTSKYREFPELMFGENSAKTIYFDATLYLEQRGDTQKQSVANFVKEFSFWLKMFAGAYQMQECEMVVVDVVSEHIMIEQSLALLFVSYVDPEFGVYIFERADELLLDGAVVSDSYLMHKVSDRFTKESLLNFIK